jgi:hypothetical protein
MMARLTTIFAVLVAALLAPSACAGKPKGGPHPHQGLSKVHSWIFVLQFECLLQ